MNNNNGGNEYEMNNNNLLSNFMLEFEDNLPFASFSSTFDNCLEFTPALAFETGFDQFGPSQNFPPVQPNWFPIMEDSVVVNIGGGNANVPGELDSSALISYGMNKEIDNDAPFTGKEIMGPPLVIEGSSSGGRDKKRKEIMSKNFLAKNAVDFDDGAPSTWKEILDLPLVTEGGSSGGQNKKGEEIPSKNLLAENVVEINDGVPSIWKNMLDSSLVTKGSYSGGRNKKLKGIPSSNVSAERKRRAKLSERLISLRSVVPKITKLDRASTLGDAINHIKDLSDKINKLKLELESPPLLESAPLLTPAAAPTSALEEVFQHPTRIEVRKREGGIVIIHMCCSWRPGLLHSIAKTLSNLGIDTQDVVYNCLEGFTLDLYRGQQSSDVPEDQIKAMLLETIRNHGVA